MKPPRPLLSQAALARRIRAMGRAITRDYRGREIVLVGVLKGSYVFMADLAREIRAPVRIDFLRVSSYGNSSETKGTIRIDFDVTQSIRGKHVLLCEDIIDTGLTARAVMRLLRAKKPASLKLCALLFKPSRRRVDIPIRYLGFTVPNKFVVGYGLDHVGLYRNLPYVGVIDPAP